MAFDKTTRNRLANFVGKARDLIADEFTQQFQSLYGISDSGRVTPLDQLRHLDDVGQATAALLRERIDYFIKTHPEERDREKAAVTRLAREQAFTVLNRLAAIRMAEKRDLVVESVGKGYQSKGFKVFEQVAGAGLGDTYHRYRRYIFCLFDELAVDLGVLFDRRSPQGLLFPRETALQELFNLLNAPDLDPLWGEDETIGWIYQYYNDPAERKKMRDESAAPRNSRELAVRNQFFTPRYVVEFLTDNTLGRIWYEMTQGGTSLKDSCRYLVRRPDEVFFDDNLSPADARGKRWLNGEDVEIKDAYDLASTVNAYNRYHPVELASEWYRRSIDRVTAGEVEKFKTQELLDLLFLVHRADHFCEGTLEACAKEIKSIIEELSRRKTKQNIDGLSQEELLRQPVYVPCRKIKDPRKIGMLDPACGSMHFGLYAFDLYEVIYEEAWDLNVKSLRHDYPDKNDFLIEVPRLIIEHNIHGIDIDPRAVQIAGLSLWLQAQKSWKKQGVPAAQRPRIMRSNIVCAESMPGSAEMLKEFTSSLHPPILGQLVATVFDRMKLAGEAGSLLKIEEEITKLIAEAKRIWSAPRKVEQTKFDLGQIEEQKQGERTLDVYGISDIQFWETAEEQIYNALKEYAEQVDNTGYQRRLFAEDAARGFAFIDLCRKRYDVVMMNPPFGVAILILKERLESDPYQNAISKNLAWGFVERAKSFTNKADPGLIGSIVDRTIFQKSSYEPFRMMLVNNALISEYLDLGFGVLDDADVRTAAFVCRISDSRKPTVFFDGRQEAVENKEIFVIESIQAISRLLPKENIFYRSASDFLDIPFTSFAYWVPHTSISSVFKQHTIGDLGYKVGGGLQCNDVFRFVRLWPELPQSQSVREMWAPFYNGGPFTGYWIQNYQFVLWSKNGQDIKSKIIYGMGDHPSRYVANEQMYFSPGVAGGKRGEYFDVHILPAGMIFSNEGRAFQKDQRSEICMLLAYLNHHICQNLVNVFCGQHKGSDYLRKIPIPQALIYEHKHLGNLALSLANMKRACSTIDEFGLEFLMPTGVFASFCSKKLIELWRKILHELKKVNDRYYQDELVIDETIKSAFDIDLAQMIMESGWTESPRPQDCLEFAVKLVSETNELGSFCVSIVMYFVGLVFGRWDIRLATGERQAPELPDPFTPLPVCPPGMLQNSEGLPAEPKDISSGYPLRISWKGILADDENHPEDILARVRETLEVIWKDRADAIEQEACELLGVKSLRDYFRRPAGFFADHLKRYSKSRRQAPIYWPLSTASGSYTLWIYYHRLTDQTLHTALADFVDPKLKAVRTEINSLMESGKHQARLEELRDLEKELSDFHAEIESIIKLPWKPNLNDGVIITASPLWKLFRLPKWQKDLKACWEKLEKGEYDWAHLAYSIWPKRVEEICKKDRSIAIAHNLEHLCEAVAPKTKARHIKR